MSHISTVEVTIKDLDSLSQACQSLGVELVLGQQTFLNYNQRQSPCDHAIRIPGSKEAYEIGVVSNKDGTYHLQLDNFMGGKGMVEKVGRDAVGLRQAYTITASTNQLQKQGFRVRQMAQADGSVSLQAVKV